MMLEQCRNSQQKKKVIYQWIYMGSRRMDLGPSSSYCQVISCSSSGSNGWLKSEFGPAPLPEFFFTSRGSQHHRPTGWGRHAGGELRSGRRCSCFPGTPVQPQGQSGCGWRWPWVCFPQGERSLLAWRGCWACYPQSLARHPSTLHATIIAKKWLSQRVSFQLPSAIIIWKELQDGETYHL